MNKNFPLISVIVPVYNVAEYLSRCLNSICNQTYKNLEIILVDDGSTDNSLKICNQYAAKDKRITVIHQENGGLSAARNTGMDHMHGEFFTFIDSDDWVTPDYCQVLLDLINQTNADVSAGNFTYAYEDGSQQLFQAPNENKIIFTGEDLFLFGFNYHHCACVKLYRTSTCKTLRFNSYYSLSEDLDFFFQLSRHITTLAYTNRSISYYYQRPHSLIRSTDLPGREKIFYLYQQLEDYCLKNHFNQAYKKIRALSLEYGCVFTILAILELNQDFHVKMQEIYSWLKKNQEDIFHLKSMRLFGHVFMRLFCYFPRATIWLCRAPGIKYLLKKIVLKRLLRGG